MSFFKRDRKINFEKEDLVVCKIAIMISGETNLWLSFDESRILLKKEDGFYYEPNGYFDSKYQKGYTDLKRGDRFVEKTDNIPIQEIKGIILTQKELKKKKISLKRLKELEQLLNEI